MLFTPWIWHSCQKKVALPPAHAGGRDEIIPINMLYELLAFMHPVVALSVAEEIFRQKRVLQAMAGDPV